ncbi:MAG: hypothetical protein OXJ63_02495 [Gammaproteobacteria bacterium]|nr:hypothetical protein [Gammaproteobacteria bacterium]
MPASEVHENAARWPDSPFWAASVYLNSVGGQDRQDGEPPQGQAPEIAVSAGDAVTEGGDAVFTFTASPAPAADLAVGVTVGTDGDWGVTAGDRTVTIPTSGSATLTLATAGDDADEPDGSVTVTVNDGDGYTVGDPASGSVAVRDDDVPEVTLAAGSAVTEGGDAVFTFTASPAPAADLAVGVTVGTDGDWGVTAGDRTVTIPTSGSATLTLATAGDDADEPDGSLTVTVNDGDGYTVGDPASESVAVGDDDEPPPDDESAEPDWTDYQTVVDYLIEARDNPENEDVKGNPAHIRKWNRVLEAIGHDTGTGLSPMPASEIHANADKWPDSPYRAASVYLNSVDAQDGQQEPEIAVSAGDAVTEGGDAVFTFTASPAPAADLAVGVTVGTDGDWGVTAGDRTVTIPTSGSATLTLATAGDDADEPDGSVTVTVNDGDGYTVGDPASGSVAVRDDDVPEVTLAAGSAVTEGGDAVFTFTASPAPAADLAVGVTVGTDGDWGVTAGDRTVTIPTSGSATLTLATAGDDADEPDGSVTVTVNDGDGYTAGDPASGSVAVQDDDVPPPDDESAEPDYTDYQTVVDYLIEVRDNPENEDVKGDPAHILKWNRVLAAVGHASGEEAMPASEIHANADKWPDSPYRAASVYLNSVEPPPVVSVDDAEVAESGDGDSVLMTFTARLSRPASKTVTLQADTRD